MKLFYGIILVLMVFVSACAQQPAEQAPVTEPEPSAGADVQPEADVEEEEEVEVTAPEEATESSSTEIRALGAGSFEPDELTINVGDTVTWINNADTEMVLIIFKGRSAYSNSQKMNDGDQFEHEFTEAGEYQFWQSIAFQGDGGTITVK